MSDEIPPMARHYLGVVGNRQDIPFMRQHFHQVTWLAAPNAKHGDADFFVLEFRAGTYSALAWQTQGDKWAAGGWLKLSHPGADVTCPPTPLTVAYLRDAKAYQSLDEALADLAGSMPPPSQGLWSRIKSVLNGGTEPPK